MQYTILNEGSFSSLFIKLEANEQIKAESGAMVAKSSHITLEGTMEGGFLKSVARSLLSNENFFTQNFKAIGSSGELILAPPIIGGIIAFELTGDRYIIQKGAFLASSMGIEISTQMQGISKGLFSGEGFFLLSAGGHGTLFLNSYGAIHKVSLESGQEYTIDNTHLVAWKDGMQYSIKKASSKGWISSATSGEGFVCEFVGPGDVYIQSHNPQALGQWIYPFLPIPKNN